MNINELLNNYQKAFNSKDLERLERMFSEDIILKDWEISAKGKNSVLKANKNIFDSVETINCKTIKNYILGNTAICVLKILIDNKDEIEVIDIIEFDNEEKICSIRAYKG